MSTCSTTRTLFYLANSIINPPYSRNYVAAFTSASNKIQKNKTSYGKKNSRSRGVAEEAVEIAKAGVVGAVDVGLKLGEMTKEIADGMWDAARNTAESVRDSINRDDDHSHWNHHMADKHVEGDLGTPARDYVHSKDNLKNR